MTGYEFHLRDMDLECLDHVAVTVSPAQLERTMRFYTEVLGLVHLYANEPDFGRDPAMLCCTR